MAAMIGKEQLLQLESFIKLCKSSPELLHEPPLKFFREYLESLGANIPEFQSSPMNEEKSEKMDPPCMDKKESPDIEEIEITDDSSDESDIELDATGIIDPDDIDESVLFGNESVEVTDEMLDESSRLRMEASQAVNDGDFTNAINLFSEAIKKNPQSAALYAKRASVFLKQEKPNTAIRDCSKALSLNPDQALAYKYRGYANKLLGNWEEAAKDLALACNLDYSDDANQWLKEVTPNVKKLQEHKRKYERKRIEKNLKERRAKYEEMKSASSAKQSEPTFGGMPEMGSFGDAFKSDSFEGLQELLKDPEVCQALQDPEVAAAFQDISQNPANFLKHQSNPKVAELMAKITQKVGGQGTA